MENQCSGSGYMTQSEVRILKGEGASPRTLGKRILISIERLKFSSLCSSIRSPRQLNSAYRLVPFMRQAIAAFANNLSGSCGLRAHLLPGAALRG